MSANIDAVRSPYDAFGVGDLPIALSVMSPDIVWHEAENFPYADGNPYLGPDAVLHVRVARCATETDGLGVIKETLTDSGDHAAASGRYGGTWPATGRAMNPQVVHIWRMNAGRQLESSNTSTRSTWHARWA